MPGAVRPPPAGRRRRRDDRRARRRRRPRLGLAAGLGRAAPPRRRAADRRRLLAVRGRRAAGRAERDGDRHRPRPPDGGDAPFDAGRALLNFTDKPRARGRFFDGYTLHQLRAVKDRVDGGDLFAANHPLEGQTLTIKRRSEPKDVEGSDPRSGTGGWRLDAAGGGGLGGSPGHDELVGDRVERGARVGEELARRRDRLGGAEGRRAVGRAARRAPGWCWRRRRRDHRHRGGAVGARRRGCSRPIVGQVVRRGGIGARSCGAPIERPLTNAARTAVRPLQATMPRPLDV